MLEKEEGREEERERGRVRERHPCVREALISFLQYVL